MGDYSTHDEVFPIIARLITRRHAETGEFVLHHDLVVALTSDPEAGPILERAFLRGTRQDRRGLAATMIAWFSQQITVGRNAWAPYFERQRAGGRYSYRPVTATEPATGHDVDLVAIEGEPQLVSHLRRERNRQLVDARKERELAATGRLCCEACGFDFRDAYPGLGLDFCEVHHNRPLSEAGAGTPTRLEDLTFLCSNCHRMIHRTRPLMLVGAFRRLLRAPR